MIWGTEGGNEFMSALGEKLFYFFPHSIMRTMHINEPGISCKCARFSHEG